MKLTCLRCKRPLSVEDGEERPVIVCPACGAHVRRTGATPDPAVWYYARAGQKVGPLSVGQLRQLADAGQLQPADMVWREGAQKWIAAASVPGFLPAAQPRPKPVAAGTATAPPRWLAAPA